MKMPFLATSESCKSPLSTTSGCTSSEDESNCESSSVILKSTRRGRWGGPCINKAVPSLPKAASISITTTSSSRRSLSPENLRSKSIRSASTASVGSETESEDDTCSEVTPSTSGFSENASDTEYNISDHESYLGSNRKLPSPGCSFSVSLLLQIRAALFAVHGPQWGFPGFGALKSQSCPKEEGEVTGSCPTSGKTSRTRPPIQESPSFTTSPTAWKPRARCIVEDDIDAVTKQIRSILNKLTLAKFDALSSQLVACVRTATHLQILISEVFEKATVQHHFIPMYAELCVNLEANCTIAAALGHKENQSQSFKRLLLSLCQSAFEELFEVHSELPKPETEEEAEAQEEARFLKKRKSLGNVKLVGELIVKGMLNSQLLCSCSDELLECHEHCSEALESLVTLLSAAAPKFDGKKDWQHQQHLENIFLEVAELANGSPKMKSKVSPRLRFLLKDLLELRASGWPGPGQRVINSPNQCFTRSQTSDRQQASRNLSAENAQRILRLAKICSANPPTSPPSSLSSPHSRTEIKTSEETFCVPKFDAAAFRRALAAILRELRVDRNAMEAVKKIRAECVPVEYQAKEFADLITRVSEDNSGPARRAAFAFIVGLCSTERSAFDRKACLEGATTFFREVYADLCQEVPRLQLIMSAEFLPMFRSALQPFDIDSILPKDLQVK